MVLENSMNKTKVWKLHRDESSCNRGLGVGLIITPLTGEAEYEAVMISSQLASKGPEHTVNMDKQRFSSNC